MTFLFGIIASSNRRAAKQLFATPGTYDFIVPAGVTMLTFKGWAPGGGGGTTRGTAPGGSGAGGGFVEAALPVTPEETLKVVIGSKGLGGVKANGNEGGSGAGYTGIFRGTVSHANALAMAGGGGGGNSANTTSRSGGVGGGTTGGDAASGSGPGTGGTQVAGGIGGGSDGAALTGGEGNNTTGGDTDIGDGPAGGAPGGGAGGSGVSSTMGGGGGGAGYFGGGGGGGGGSTGGGGGGGGSGYDSTGTGTLTQASGTSAANDGDPEYVEGHGVGGVGAATTLADGQDGGDGLAILKWTA